MKERRSIAPLRKFFFFSTTHKSIPADRRRLTVAVALGCCLLGLGVFAAGGRAALFAATITGTIYIDYNQNGTRDTGGAAPNYAVDSGTGLSGVVVTAYDATGVSVGTVMTGASGTYSLSVPGTATYRVEFTSLPSGYYPGAVGTNNASTVRFVSTTDGATTSGIDLGLSLPAFYTQNLPELITNCYVFGAQNAAGVANDPVLINFPYSAGNTSTSASAAEAIYDTPATHTLMVPAQSIGTTFGLAYARNAKRIYAAAFFKRHAGFGPGDDGTFNNSDDPGAIYLIDRDTGTVSGTTFTVPSATTNSHNTGNYNTDNGNTGWDAVGKTSLGGLDISADETTLYVMNLQNRTLYALNAGTGAVIASQTVPTSGVPTTGGTAATAAAGDVRPFAVRYYQGVVYVGLMTTGESTNSAGDLFAHVYSVNATTLAFSAGPVFTARLNYARGKASTVPASAAWRAWRPTFTNLSGVANRASNPQPMFTDLVFDNGNLIIGLRDRMGDQIGHNTFSDPSNPTTQCQPRSAGELLRACGSVGSWTLESNGRCGGTGTAQQNTGQGPGSTTSTGSGEFYFGDAYDLDDGGIIGAGSNHDEVALGTMAQLPGAEDVLTTVFDPIPNIANMTFDGGMRWLRNSGTSAGAFARAYRIYNDAQATLPGTEETFGKANGLGEIELLADPAPLELGNRVWNDSNGNGVQDPGENGIQNVTVQLWADTNSDSTVDTQVGTATTDAGGNYYFGGPNKTNMLASCGSTNLTVRVGAGSDDANEEATGNMQLSNSFVELGDDPGAAGLRFTNVTIPSGSVITSATLTFTAESSTSGTPVSMTIAAEATANSTTFTSAANNITSRPRTSSTVAWTNIGAWTVNTTTNAVSPSLTTVIQEIVNYPGWASGNSLNLILTNNGSTQERRAYSFDGTATVTQRPTLNITYICAPFAVNQNTAYEIRIPNASGGSKQAALGANNLVTANTDPGTNGDARDSDATMPSTTAIIALTTGAYGENNHTYDFGFTAATVNYSIGNRLWYDTDNDGVFDVTEVNLGSGFTVDLLNNADVQIQTTTTSASGYYRFDGVAAGTYKIRVRNTNFTVGGLNAYQNSTGSTSATDQRDSGIDPASNNPSTAGVLSASFTIGPALQPTAEPDFTASGAGAHGANGDVTDNLTVDFGFYKLTLGNLVFEDTNNNGVFNGGVDAGLANAQVALYQSDGNTIVPVGPDGILGTADDTSTLTSQFVTVAGGAYLFQGLPPGSYRVRVVPPAGYRSAGDTANTANPNSGTDQDDNGPSALSGPVVSGIVTITAGSATNGATVTNATGLTANPTVDFGFVAGATAVELAEFTAAADTAAAADATAGNGKSAERSAGVTLNWRTGFEADNLGFNVYRDENGDWLKLNPALIAGSALLTREHTIMTAGNAYSWRDRKGWAGANYLLEALDLNGTSTRHGPLTAVERTLDERAFETADRRPALLLHELNDQPLAARAAQLEWAGEETGYTAAELNRAAPGQPTPKSQPWTLPSQKAAKLAVRQAGWYRVTQAELAAVGFDTNVNPARLQLFADGLEVALKVNGKSAVGFDSLEFYGRGLDVQATDTRIYWLTTGNAARRWESAPARQPERAERVVNSFASTVELKERLIYFSGLLNGEAENWFGQVVTPAGVTQTLTTRFVDYRAGGDARLEVVLQGVTEQAHAVNLELNGNFVGTARFGDKDHSTAQFQVPLAHLRDGANELKLISTVGARDFSLVDVVCLTYPRRYRAARDGLHFTLGAGQTALLTGFNTPNVRLLQFGRSETVRELTVQTSLVNDEYGQSYGFTLQGDGGGSYLALADAQLERVAGTTLNQPSDWRAAQNTADFIIVTPAVFKAAADKLAQARRARGLTTVVVDVEDAYDEFDYGAHTPAAVKALLTHAGRNWRRTPGYALFLGAGINDPRDHQGTGAGDFVPVKLGDAALLETAFENWFVDANDDGLPEMALGRLPVRTPEQAEAVVAGLINFKPDERWRGALLVSDATTDEYDFAAISRQLADALPASMTKQFIKRTDGSTEVVREQIVQSINRTQPLVVNWNGHGAPATWTGAGIFRREDAAALTNRAPALFVMTTCLNGYFVHYTPGSLAEAVLTNPGGGGFGVVASTAMTPAAPQSDFNQRFYRALFAGNQTLGEAFRTAKQGDVSREVRDTYVLLGDPTVRLSPETVKR